MYAATIYNAECLLISTIKHQEESLKYLALANSPNTKEAEAGIQIEDHPVICIETLPPKRINK